MKRAQLHSQIFIYILTLMIMGFILVFGYKAITDINSGTKKISCLGFRRDLQGSIRSVMSDFGSIRKKEMDFCPDYKRVCFVESYESPSIPAGTDPIIKDSILSNSESNVFLIQDLAKDSFYAGKISVEPDVMCIDALRNRISIALEGKGNHVEIRPG